MDCSSWPMWLFCSIFALGYLLITFEHFLRIDKAAVALIMATVMWMVFYTNNCYGDEASTQMLLRHFVGTSQVIFFLLGALTIVEVVSTHDGFSLLEGICYVKSKQGLLWWLGGLSFFLSGVLDNLTTTIVMLSILRQMMPPGEERQLMGGGIVIAANAGGAWTPIGDVTTTMLWIGGEVTTGAIVKALFLPSFAGFIASFFYLSSKLKGPLPQPMDDATEPVVVTSKREIVFAIGLGVLLLVPVLKITIGLPPFMGILFGLGVIWFLLDKWFGRDEASTHLTMEPVFQRLDYASLFFFCGILLAVGALESAEVLRHVATWLDSHLANMQLIALSIGFMSAIIDNVPLVAATMGMYSLQDYAQDHAFWKLIAYCAGTGGSLLIIGSAAGVVYMGIEKVSFGWYIKRISLPALLSYLVGVGVYLVMEAL